MREIKFRIFNKRKQRMIEWDQIPRNYGLKTLSDNKENEDFSSWMQYTGLKDKNGKGIYDRDIIQNVRGSYLQVSYEDGAYIVKGFDALNKRRVIDHLHTFNNWSEVKGNIYENPDLLEGNR